MPGGTVGGTYIQSAAFNTENVIPTGPDDITGREFTSGTGQNVTPRIFGFDSGLVVPTGPEGVSINMSTRLMRRVN